MSAVPQHDSAYSWARLAVTLAVATVGSVGIWAPVTVLPAMQADFGVDRGDASLPYTAAMIGFALGNLVIGRLVDRFGIAVALAGAGAMAGLGFASAALTPSLTVVTAMHLAVGLGAAACFGPLLADISHWFLARRGIAVAVAASGNYLSGAIWPMILAGVQDEHGWRGTYLVLAAAVPAVVLPLAYLLRRRVSEETAASATTAAARMAQSVALSPRALTALLALSGVSCCVAMAMPQVHIVAYCADLGYGPAAGA
ncbi:MAG TPA: MFS transporter, partial [Paracoccaceae bacterium]|nr:MFS transporter [Paracoccaceae bacterium]